MCPTREIIVIPATKNKESDNVFTQKRVAAYCRVSTDQEEQLTSYENQLEYYTEKIMRNPEWQMAGIFADEGITGTQTKNRTEFKKMIKKCEKGNIDIILTKSISRFARNTVDCLNYVRLLKSLGIAVIFEKENINTMSAESETLISLLASLAQAESESISGNVKWGKRKGYANGKVTIAYNHLLGYKKGEDGNPVIVEKEADIIKFIYNSYLAGGSLLTIKKGLEDNGYKTKKGCSEWSTYIIRHILENEKYVGDVIMQKTYITDCISKKVKVNNGELPKYWIKNNHPAIIDRVTWNRVQKEKARRSGKRKVSDKTKTELSKYSSKYALSELLICGKCGSHYRRVTWARNGKNKRVWRCISRLNHGTKYCKDSPTLNEENIESAILKEINKHISSDKLNSILTSSVNQVISENKKDDNNPFIIQQKIGKLDDMRNEMIAATKNIPINNRKAHFERIGKISDEVNSLKAKLSKVKIHNTHNVNFDEILTLGTQIIEFENNTIRQLIHYIRVIDKDTLEIKFKHSNAKELFVIAQQND